MELFTIVSGILANVISCSVLFPQLIKNYKDNDCSDEGLNYDMVLFWTIGDVLLFMGAINKHVEVYVVLGIAVKILFDIVLLLRYFYVSLVPEGDMYFLEREQLVMLQSRMKKLLFGTVVVFACKYALITMDGFDDALMWITTGLFIMARLRQIQSNYTTKNVSHLSPYTFVLLLLSNSILVVGLVYEMVMHTDAVGIYIQLCVGLCLSSVLDCFILAQYYSYKTNHASNYSPIC